MTTVELQRRRQRVLRPVFALKSLRFRQITIGAYGQQTLCHATPPAATRGRIWHVSVVAVSPVIPLVM